MKSAIRALLVVSPVLLLSACGGGGGGSDGGGEPGPPIITKTFTVNLSGVDVRRASNGSAVSVDVTGITSREMTLNQ